MEIEYDGTNYAGWQYQPNKKTVQGEIERALNQINQQNIKVYGTSRTDAGVSALGQIANFKISSMRFKNMVSFRKSINAVLPDDIYVRKMKIVADDFHARYSSKGKVYEYRIITNESPTRRRFAWIIPYQLDIKKMRKAAKLFIRQKDYKEFCKVKDKSGIVIMKSIKISKDKDEITFRIEANRFLYKMVRRIIGALVEIGRGHRTEDDIRKAMIGEKHHPLICAPAKGLILTKVIY
jgi:tRNA pseudouridine38-40 synthase